MPIAYELTGDDRAFRSSLEVWCECLEQMRRHKMNPALLELAGDLAAEIREKDKDVPPAELLARLAARLNALVVLNNVPGVPPGPADFLTTLIGLTSAELAQ